VRGDEGQRQEENQKQGYVKEDEGRVGTHEGVLEVSPLGRHGPVGQKHGEVQDIQGGRPHVLEEKEFGRQRVGLDGPQKDAHQVLDKDVEKRITGEAVSEGVDVEGELFGKTEGHLTNLAPFSAARLNPGEETRCVNVPRGAGAGTGAQQGSSLLFVKADSARFHSGFVDFCLVFVEERRGPL